MEPGTPGSNSYSSCGEKESVYRARCIWLIHTRPCGGLPPSCLLAHGTSRIKPGSATCEAPAFPSILLLKPSTLNILEGKPQNHNWFSVPGTTLGSASEFIYSGRNWTRVSCVQEKYPTKKKRKVSYSLYYLFSPYFTMILVFEELFSDFFP